METRGVVSAGRMPHTQSPGALLGEDNEFTAKATPESGGSWIERSPGVALTGAIRAALTSVRMRKRAVSRCERWKVGCLTLQRDSIQERTQRVTQSASRLHQRSEAEGEFFFRPSYLSGSEWRPINFGSLRGCVCKSKNRIKAAVVRTTPQHSFVIASLHIGPVSLVGSIDHYRISPIPFPIIRQHKRPI
jgi:hypothetical protein